MRAETGTSLRLVRPVSLFSDLINDFFKKIDSIHIKYLDYLDDQMMRDIESSFARDAYRALVADAIKHNVSIIVDDIAGKPIGKLSQIGDKFKIVPL